MKMATVILAMLLAGCANRPETIHASFVSFESFMDLNCSQMNAKMSNTRAELDKFSKMQDSKATGDAWGVFLIGVPFSKLSGDHEGDVARLKGEVEAIKTAQVKGKCFDGSGPALNAANAPPASVTASQVTGAALSPYPRQPPADTRVVRAAVGADTLQAEQFARGQSCNTAPVASLVAKGPGYETFSMACTNGDTMMVRCEYGNCRTLR